MLALFHDKKCCNYFNFGPCILWDFTVLGLVLSWWRIKHELKNKWISREAHEKLTSKRAMWETHARSWKFTLGCCFCECLARYPWNSLPGGFLSVTFLPFTHTIYTIITQKSIRRPFREKNSRYVFYNTHPSFRDRATYT